MPRRRAQAEARVRRDASLASDAPTDGLTRNERYYFRLIAAHRDIAERVIAESTEEQPASRRRVLAAIAAERRKAVT